ncbi:hypothetical protein [Sphaerospermopsis sp. FACHB-1194]|uniref:hypothetical protein n=1 Tax=Sphaerospermopsis sp. FACHB-1194 TaxID=2692862 RepID=UPI001680DEAA|nr:hypothetical protein [Sphaerospermopsis sp. FACHB-1194]MBD2148502.1 hypothetical protein [Sphaerospermopsis sp. FACHB-1194]
MAYMTESRRDPVNGGGNQTRSSSDFTVFENTRNLLLEDKSDPMGLETDSEQNQADSQSVSKIENQLNEAEALELDRLEKKIEKGLRGFWEVGQSLDQIRDKRLYRQNYKTFEEYCLNRWEFSRRSAYRLIQGASVYENLRRGSQTSENVTHGSQNKILPTNERQVRPLTTLSPDEQREVWAKAVSTAPGGKVTSGRVAQIVREYHRENSGNKSRKGYSFDKQQQSTNDSQQSLNRSCWNCLYCSRDSVKDDPQSFYCDRLGKLSFVEKDGNQRGAECEYWTYRFGESSQVRKNVIPLRETFNVNLQLPAHLQPLLQDAAKDSGLTVMDWLTKLVEEKLSHENENFVGTVVSEVA